MIAALPAFFFFLLLNTAAVEAAAQSECPTRDIIVNKRNQLEELLCPYRYEECINDITLSLSTDVIHEIRSGNYCTINITHSLTIISNPTDTIANVKCIPKKETHYDKYWTRGFAFYGTNASLTIRGLSITNCGTNLTTLDGEIINSTSSPIHFTKYQAAVLVFTNIASLMVDNVTITNYSGFAIVAVNLPNASFNCLNIANSQNWEIFAFRQKNIGSGMLLLFFNQKNNESVMTNGYDVKINNSAFNENFAFHQYYPEAMCAPDVYHCYKSSMPVINAAGITTLYAQNDTSATVSIINCNLTNCVGYLAAALSIIRFPSYFDSETKIIGSYFSKNSIIGTYCHGAAIAANVYYDNKSLNSTYRPLSVINTTFSHNGVQFLPSLPSWSSGAISIEIYKGNKEKYLSPSIILLFRNLTFESNDVYDTGSCIYGVTYVYHYIEEMENNVNFILESIIAYNNPSLLVVKSSRKVYIPKSLFRFLNVHFVTINGSITNPGNFSHNYGSIFKLSGSNVILGGHLIFDSNIADHGAALSMLGNSQIYLTAGFKANFTNNTAQSFGGAIYAAGDTFLRAPCTFQLYSNNSNDISLTFKNNTATLAGTNIYSVTLYRCYLRNGSMEKIGMKEFDMYKHIFKGIPSSSISSLAHSIHLCNATTHYNTYPGKTLHIPVKVLDHNGSPTYAVVTVAAFEKSNNLKPVKWWFSDNQESTIVKGTGKCTILNLTIHAQKVSPDDWTLLLITISERNNFTSISVKMKDCPLGFYLNKKTGTCLCSNLFTKLEYDNQVVLCHIDNNTFSKPNNLNIWVGNCTGNRFCIAYCTSNYCNNGIHFDALFINKTGTYLNSSSSPGTAPIPLCHGFRTGDLCGRCMANYSVVFGSTKCELCTSKWWPLTAIVYIIAGPLIVLLLYTLNLTLTTGTLNGVIFYAQLANIGLTSYFNTPCYDCSKETHYLRFSVVFISWLNLNLGFPLCFFNGMNELWKAGLSLLFPIYLILLIGFLIILSRMSSRVSNRLSQSSVQVLITVVHLSFAKLIQAIIDVFCSVYIHIENSSHSTSLVWYSDGAVAYANTKHKILMIITSVVVGVVILPYMAVILLGKPLLMKVDKLREVIRPCFEAIHAPYKVDKWYWFGLHQIFVLVVYAIDTIGGGKELPLLMFLVTLLVYHTLLAFQSNAMPFKSKILNMLNIILLLNLNVLFMISECLLLNNPPQTLAMYFAIGNYPIIVIFFFIIVYHVLVVTNKLRNVILLYNKIRLFIFNLYVRRETQDNAYPREFTDTGDYTQAREPLLEYGLN